MAEKIREKETKKSTKAGREKINQGYRECGETDQPWRDCLAGLRKGETVLGVSRSLGVAWSPVRLLDNEVD